jgi:hypothetical protein
MRKEKPECFWYNEGFCTYTPDRILCIGDECEMPEE